MARRIANRPLSTLSLGERAVLERSITEEDIALFAAVTGDVNPAHLDADYARDSRFHGVIAHGLWGAGLISALLGVELPGPGTIYLSQSLRFTAPIRPGQTIRAEIMVTKIDLDTRRVTLECRVLADGVSAISGEAVVLAPHNPVELDAHSTPDARLIERPVRLTALAGARNAHAPSPPARPVGAAWLVDAPAAAGLRLFACGPKPAWRALARAAGLDAARAARAEPRALVAAASKEGPHVLVCDDETDAERFAACLDGLGGGAATGFILTEAGPQPHPNSNGAIESAAARAVITLVQESTRHDPA